MPTVDSRKYLSLIICILGALLAALFSISKHLDLNSSLHKHSKLIWTLPEGISLLGYDWLNMTQIVYFCNDRGTIQVCSLNLLDRMSTVMPIPTESLRRANVKEWHPINWQISPTRTQLLVKEMSKEDSKVFVIGLFRSNLVRFPFTPTEAEFRWLPQDAGIAQFVTRKGQSEMRVFSLSSMQDVTTVRLPIPLGFPTAFCRRDTSLFSARSYGNIVEVDHVQVWPKTAVLKQLNFNLSVSGVEESPSFSLDGERLAWVEAISPSFATYAGREHALIVANLISNAIREIGRSNSADDISQLRWTSDENSVSYLSGRNIYLINCNN